MGDDLARDIVLGRAQPATTDHRIAAFQGMANGVHHAIEIIADFGLVERIDTGKRQLFTDPRRIGINDLSQQQFRTDRDDFTTHSAASPRIPIVATGQNSPPRRKRNGCGRGAASAIRTAAPRHWFAPDSGDNVQPKWHRHGKR